MSIMYRHATSLDAPDLLRWKNDPVTRHFAIETAEEISPERHAKWMEWMLSNPNVRVYIIDVDNIPCGDVRGEIHLQFIEMAIKIDPKFRGKGIAATALKAIGDLLQNEFQKTLMARIVYGNVASMRLFESCGYKVVGHGEGYGVIRSTPGYYFCSKEYTPTSK